MIDSNKSTKVYKLDPENFENRELEEAARILREGGLVAFPTETVYGLGGNALLPESSKMIYAAKGRPSDNPLIVHISEKNEVYDLAAKVNDVAEKLMDKFWPGPLTLIFKKKDVVPDETTGGLDTVAVRNPKHDIARALIKESGVPIAAPSANTSGSPSPTKAEHVICDLLGKVDGIIDGGSTDIGLESTIIDVSGDVPALLRPGYYTYDMITEVVGECTVDPVVIAREKPVDVKPKAPGMKYRHYAPKGEMLIVTGPQEKVVQKINELSRKHMDEGKKVAVLATADNKDAYVAQNVLVLGNKKIKGEIAHNLFDVLRHCDEIKADYIFAEELFDSDMGNAIMNRLNKAAGYNRIKCD